MEGAFLEGLGGGGKRTEELVGDARTKSMGKTLITTCYGTLGLLFL